MPPRQMHFTQRPWPWGSLKVGCAMAWPIGDSHSLTKPRGYLVGAFKHFVFAFKPQMNTQTITTVST
jgi:hypothetical protein